MHQLLAVYDSQLLNAVLCTVVHVLPHVKPGQNRSRGVSVTIRIVDGSI
jgi:hypothetical protein